MGKQQQAKLPATKQYTTEERLELLANLIVDHILDAQDKIKVVGIKPCSSM